MKSQFEEKWWTYNNRGHTVSERKNTVYFSSCELWSIVYKYSYIMYISKKLYVYTV